MAMGDVKLFVAEQHALVGSERCFQLQTTQWPPQWWGRGSLQNYTPSS